MVGTDLTPLDGGPFAVADILEAENVLGAVILFVAAGNIARRKTVLSEFAHSS